MPPGHLLVQAGKQLEYVAPPSACPFSLARKADGFPFFLSSRHLTGGLIAAGFHEVVCTDATLAAMEGQRSTNPDRPLIRISSTFFYHLSPEEQIEPLPELEERRKMVLSQDKSFQSGEKTVYPKMYVGELVQRELQHISLMA
jgi:hypothetical protein